MRKNNSLKLSLSYRRCQSFTQMVVNIGYSKITLSDLNFLIKRNLGGDPRTVRKYKHLLVEYGFVKPSLNYYTVMPLVSMQKTLNQYPEVE